MAPGHVVGHVGLPSSVPVVHAITNDEIIGHPDFIDTACAVMRVLGARGALHLRTSPMMRDRFGAIAEALSAAQTITGAWLVINDSIEVALRVNAKGVQLNSRSLPVAEARLQAENIFLGASVRDGAESVASARAGADWLVAGQAFAGTGTSSEDARNATWLKSLTQSVRVPVIAIGGVRVEHAEILHAAGVYGVAIIRGIWNAANAEQAASDYLSAYERAVSR